MKEGRRVGVRRKKERKRNRQNQPRNDSRACPGGRGESKEGRGLLSSVHVQPHQALLLDPLLLSSSSSLSPLKTLKNLPLVSQTFSSLSFRSYADDSSILDPSPPALEHELPRLTSSLPSTFQTRSTLQVHPSSLSQVQTQETSLSKEASLWNEGEGPLSRGASSSC